MKIITSIYRLFFSVMLWCPLTLNAAPIIVETSTTSFGLQITPVVGACDLAHDTSILSNLAGNICPSANGGSRGHYKVFATPNTTVRIVVRPHNNNGDGVVFAPNGVVFSDSTGPIAFVEHATTNIDSGVSGIVEIYVGGVLTLVSKTPSSTSFTFTHEIDYSEIP